MRRLGWLGVVALSACSLAPQGGAEHQAGAIPAIHLDQVARGSALARAGAKDGDRLVAWTRGDEGAPFDGFDDLDELEWEHAPRGPVTLILERAGRRLETVIPSGRWRGRARPALAGGFEGLPSVAALQRIRAATPHAIVRAWASWRLATTDAEPEEHWARAVEAAREASDRKLESWIEQERCRQLLLAGELDSAEQACRRALALRADRAAPLGAVQVRYHIARVAGRRGDPAVAERHYRALRERLGREVPGTLPEARALLGYAQMRATQGDLEQAFALANEALAICERSAPRGLDHEASLMMLGILHWFAQDWDRAEARLSEGLAMLEGIDPAHEDVASMLNNLGLVAAHRGDLVTAEDFYRRALAFREGIRPDPLQASRTLNNLAGLLRTRGDIEASIDYDRQVLALRERIEPDSVDTATPLQNLSDGLTQIGRFEEAERHLERALALYRRHTPASRDVAETLRSLAEIHLQREDPEGAQALYDEALVLIREVAPRSAIAASLARGIGQLRVGLGELSAAEAPLRESVALFEALAPSTLEAALSLHALGSLLRAQGRKPQALAAYTDAALTLDRQFGALGGSDAVRSRFRESWRHIYRDLADLLLELGRDGEAFEVLERSRARAFLFMLRAREIELPRLPVELEREREQVAAAYDDIQAQIGDRLAAGDTAAVAELAAQRIELQRQRDRLGVQVARQLPRMAALGSSLRIAEAQEALGSDVAAVAYSIETSGSRAWILNADSGLRVIELGVGAPELRDLVDRFRLLLQVPAPQANAGPLGRRLYDILIAPIEPYLVGIERLVVLPDGPLHHLPFAALVRRDAEGDDSFLIESKSVQVAPSVTAWAELRHRPESRGGALVAFADPALPLQSVATAGLRGSRPVALPGSRREAERIAALVGAAARVLVGAAANEPAAKQVGKQVRFLHFATHAVVDPWSPLDSALLLAPGHAPSGRLDNGLLQAWEVVQGLKMEAELVTLSACETGLGTLVADEGILGLARAFHFAGARAVLASLWKVADSETADLMAEFYRELLSGQPADVALRRAQLVLSGRPESHPNHWAAFQLFGAAGDVRSESAR
jgi:CHAT domain-containing protein/Tfp pilus assembly protein PilF